MTLLLEQQAQKQQPQVQWVLHPLDRNLVQQ
jgi:hypothetical protein